MSAIPTATPPDFTNYETPAGRPGLVSRLLPTAMFYTRVSRVVFASSHRARTEGFTDEDWYRASLQVRSAFESCGTRMVVRGTENLAKVDPPCVLIGNHMSTAETFLLGAILLPFFRATFVVKQSLVEYPIFKHIMRSRDPIVVGRVNPREDLKAVLNGGRERFDEGISVVIFPQRTRTVEFNPESFNTIGVKLAKRAGVPVVPFALKTNAWSNGKLFKDYGRFLPDEDVRFEFGEPMEVGTNDRAVHDAVVSFIRGRLKDWGVPVAG